MDENATTLFVCQHGSAKSLIAMAHFNRLAAERGLTLRASSAGTEPDDEVPPHVLAGLRADGIDLGPLRPAQVTQAMARRAARIVSFGPRLDQLVPAGRRVEAWEVPAVSDDYAIARDAIVARVRALLAEGR